MARQPLLLVRSAPFEHEYPREQLRVAPVGQKCRDTLCDRYSQVLGSSAHTDWGLLTIILADDTPGLELYWTVV
eukprot:5831493-Amphidinium_carterae.1